MEITGFTAPSKNSTSCVVGRACEGPSGPYVESIPEPHNKMLLAVTTERHTVRIFRSAQTDSILLLVTENVVSRLFSTGSCLAN